MNNSKIAAMILMLASLAFLTSCITKSNAESRSADLSKTTDLNWLDWNELDQSGSDKKVLVDIYTDWCKWCKVMDQQTFQNPKLRDYMTTNFNLVKLNAESKQQFQLKGEQFDFIKNGNRGYNTLATKLCGDRLSYPSFVILDKDYNVEKVIRGFKNAEQFQSILENH